MHQRKRLELIIERMALARAREILEASGLTGYTIISAMAGFGAGRRWRRGDLSTAEEMTVVIAIGDEEKVKRALVDLHKLIESQIGVLSVSTVEVLRPDRF